MLKKIFLGLGMLGASLCFALAPVDVNKADQAALDGVRGIGPTTSKAILDERKRAGPFKDWADFTARVKGVGDRKSTSLSKAGLTVNGQPKANVPVPVTEKTTLTVPPAKAMPDLRQARAEPRR